MHITFSIVFIVLLCVSKRNIMVEVSGFFFKFTLLLPEQSSTDILQARPVIKFHVCI